MKKLSVIAILGLLVLGMAATASAADIKATGNWKIEAYNLSGADFYKAGGQSEGKSFNIEQRVRTAFTFIANENLRGILDTQIGPANWGNGLFTVGAGRGAGGTAIAAGPGNSGNSGAGNIMLRKGYIDFKWPGTAVNILAGFQTVSLPAAFGGGSAIFDDQAAAAMVVTPVTDNVKLLAGFSRLINSDVGTTASTTTWQNGSKATGDVVFAAVPVDFKGFNITPFAAYANLGADVAADGTGATALRGFNGVNSSLNEGVRAYWGGFATTITAFDGFKIMADFNYGKATWNNQSSTNKADGGRAGWLADIAVDYTGLSMMTPSAFFVYSSGEEGNSTDNDKSGRMPVVANPQNWAVGSFFFGDREFATNPIATGGTTSNVMGFWAAGVSLKDIKLIDKLSHTAHLIYIQGTNDKNFINENTALSGVAANNAAYGRVLTEKDSLWEIDFNTKYMIYDELSVLLNLGYIANNIDKDTWANQSTLAAATRNDIRNNGGQDAYRIALGVNYNF